MATSKQIRQLNILTTHEASAYLLVQNSTSGFDTHAILSENLFTRAMFNGVGTVGGSASGLAHQLRVKYNATEYLDLIINTDGTSKFITTNDATKAGFIFSPVDSDGNTANFFRVTKNDNTSVLEVDAANSRVGIGKAAPTAALDVVGDIKASAGVVVGDSSLTGNGTIRYNTDDLQGRIDGAWVSLSTPTVPDASLTVKGIVELATTGETTTGTDAVRAVTPAGVQAAIDALVDSAPGALDTLNELAAAIADDASYATTVTNLLAAKAPIASPTFTGTATSPDLILTGLSNAGTDTDQFLVLDASDNVDFRTGAEVLSDIGGQAAGTYNTVVGIDTDFDTSGAQVLDTLTLTDGVIQALTLRDLTVSSSMMEANSVDSDAYVDGSIYTAHIGNTQITTAKIAADAVTGAKIADDTIDSEHYVAASIDNEHLADDAVGTAEIADDAITSALIANDAIVSAAIADDAVLTAHIADDQITADLMADNSIDSAMYVDGSIDTAHIGDDQVTAAKLADNSVDSSHYVDGSIDNAHIADNAIDSEHYADASIDTAHIGNSQVTTAKLADGAVTTAKLDDVSVTAAKLAINSVIGTKIADESIDSEHYVDGSIDEAHLNITNAGASVDGFVLSYAHATGNFTWVAGTGDITSVVAGSGLTGGAVEGAATLNVIGGEGITANADDIEVTDAGITTAKIANDAVTAAKIADNAIDSDNYIDLSIDTAHIGNSQVTTAKIDDDAVTGAKIAANAIDSDHYTDASIQSAHIGNLQVTTAKLDDDAVTGLKVADNSINSEHYVDGSIDTAHIADSQITTAKIAANAIDSDQYIDGSIDEAHLNITNGGSGVDGYVLSYTHATANFTWIESGAGSGDITSVIAGAGLTGGALEGDATLNVVGGDGITANADEIEVTVDGSTIELSLTNGSGAVRVKDAGITTAKIADDAVTGAKIADDAIDSGHYVDGSIDTAHLGDAQVTTAKVADGAITGNKIADDSVTGAKIPANAIDSGHYTNVSIDTAHIGNLQVTTGKIAADAIDGTKLADNAVDSEHYTDGSIDNEHIADNAIDSEHYVDGSIDTAHIGNLQVTTGKIAADAIDGTKLADNAVDSEHYTDGSIDNAHIADDAIDSEHYADGSIDLAHMSVNSVDSDQYVDGSIDTAHIADDQITNALMADDAIGIAQLSATGTPGSGNFLRGDNTWQEASGAISAVSSGADNRVATFTSADALNGEAGLTFSGGTLSVLGGTPTIIIGDDDAEDTAIKFMGAEDDYWIGLDDTDDDFKIGRGSTVNATTNVITIVDRGGTDWGGAGVNRYGVHVGLHDGIPGQDDRGADFYAHGAGASRYMQWDESTHYLQVISAAFRVEQQPAHNVGATLQGGTTSPGYYGDHGDGTNNQLIIDWSEGNYAWVHLEADVDVITFKNMKRGGRYILRLEQNSASAKDVAWDAIYNKDEIIVGNKFTEVRWMLGAAPTTSQTTSDVDVYGFLCTRSNGKGMDCFVVAQGMREDGDH